MEPTIVISPFDNLLLAIRSTIKKILKFLFSWLDVDSLIPDDVIL